MIKAIIFLFLSVLFATLGTLELYWPDIFAWSELLIEQWPNSFEYQHHFAAGQILLAFPLLIPAYRAKSEFTLNTLEVLARLGFGAMFIGASVFKIDDPASFALATAQYQMLPQFAINLFALTLPMLEFIVGLLLLFSPFNKQNGVLLGAMFIMFIIALATAVYRDLGIVCGCFTIEGAQDKSDAWISLIRDIILLPGCWLLWKRPNKFIWQTRN